MAKRISIDEDEIKNEFIHNNAELADKTLKATTKELRSKSKRTEKLSRLIQNVYEDKVKGKIPEDICIGFIEKYSAEQKSLRLK